MFERKFGEVVRLEVQHDMPEDLRTLLMEELREEDAPEVALPRPSATSTSRTLLDLGDLMSLGVDRPAGAAGSAVHAR